MYKKLLTASIFTLFILFVSSKDTFAVCAQREGTVGKCGTAGDCGANQKCNSSGSCTTDEACVNADNSQGIICGVNDDTDYKCGPTAGGCAEGFMCRDPFGWDNARCVEINPNVTDPSCTASIPPLKCGEVSVNPNRPCDCQAIDYQLTPLDDPTSYGYCCGFKHINGCYTSQDEQLEAIKNGLTNNPSNGEVSPLPEDGDTGNTSNEIDIFDGPKSENFDMLNPLTMFGNEEAQSLRSPGAIVSRMLTFAFPLAGLILFVMIVWGGFEMLTSAASKGVEAGKQRVTAAIVGFTLLFMAYWIFQIVEVIFGVVIL